MLAPQLALTPFAKQCLAEMAPKYVLEVFQEAELLVNITQHVLVPKHQVRCSWSLRVIVPLSTKGCQFKVHAFSHWMSSRSRNFGQTSQGICWCSSTGCIAEEFLMVSVSPEHRSNCMQGRCAACAGLCLAAAAAQDCC